MGIEELVKKHARLAEGMRYWDAEILLSAALTELAAEYEQRLSLLKGELKRIAEQLNDPRENLTHSTAQCIASLQDHIRQLEAERVPSPSCRECANRGRVNGLSQETYCESCVWQGQSFRVNQYAAPQQKKEGE